MRLKLIFVLPFIFLFANFNIVFSQGTWYRLDSLTENNLRNVEFTDSLTGWVSGEAGTIIKTTDGGNSWNALTSGAQSDIIDLFILNKNNGWAVTHQYTSNSDQYGTIILSTSDGGEHWQTDFIAEDFIYAIYFLDSLSGWIGGASGLLKGTSDRGVTWFDVTVDSIWYSYLSIFDFNFFNPQYGIAIGGFIDIAGVIWRTTDGGQNWSTVRLGSEPLHAIEFLDSLNILVTGGDLEYGAVIIRSTDGGLSWTYESVGIFGEGLGMDFVDRREGWITLGYSGTYMYSLDSGYTWTELYTPDTTQVYDIVFTDPAHGFIVGNYGAIYKYQPSTTQIINETTMIPDDYILYQNYPNPFNPITRIEFSLPHEARRENQEVNLKVYDMLGREVAVLVDNGYTSGGVYSVEFDASGLSSGIYLYKLQAGTFVSVKKMVLLK